MKKYILYTIGILGVIFMVRWTDWKEISAYIQSISIGFLMIGFFLQIVTIMLITFQWKSMVSWIDPHCRLQDVFKVNMKGNVVDAITPGVKVGGELARIYELKKVLKLDTSGATAVVGLQKTVSLLSFLFLTIISTVWFAFTMGAEYQHYMSLFLLALGILALGLGAIISICIHPPIAKKLIKNFLPPTERRKKIEEALETYQIALEELLKKKEKFAVQFILGIFIWMLFAIKMYIVVKGFNLEIHMFSILAITYLTYMVGMIPLLPGSIGSFESSMVVLLGIIGINIEQGIAISVVFRFVTFWFEFWISIIALGIDKMKKSFKKGGIYAETKI